MHKNENRPGYKKTKVGWIPEGWSDKPLKRITKFRRGSFPQPYGLPEWYDEKHGTPFVQVYDVDSNMRLKPFTKQKISEVAKAKSVFAEKGTVVLTIQGSIGRIAKIQYDAYIDRTLLIFSSFLMPTDKTFFMHSVYLLFDKEKRSAPGGTIKTITKEVLSDFIIALPPLPEQEAIAEVLECWDKGVRTLENKIVKKRLIKKGLMQALLSGEKRLPAFKPKDSECRISNSECRIPKDWKTVKLGSLGKTISGGTPETEDSRYWNGGIPWCTPTEFAKLETRFIEKTDRTLSELGLKKSSATILPPNSIIVCTRATVGACAINSVPMATNQGFKSLVPSNQTDCTFIYYVLTTLKNHFIRFSSGSTFLELSKRDFEKTKISLPPLEEQRAIAEVLAAADGEIEALERKLALWKDQKKFLLNNLVTGTVRLPAFAGK